MLFSRRRGRYVSRRGSENVTYEDPYSPDGADYGKRNAQHVTELDGGLVRVDIGEPVKRLPSEPQAVPVGKAKAAPAVPPQAPAERPVSAPTVAPKVPRKEHRAITREP